MVMKDTEVAGASSCPHDHPSLTHTCTSASLATCLPFPIPGHLLGISLPHDHGHLDLPTLLSSGCTSQYFCTSKDALWLLEFSTCEQRTWTWLHGSKMRGEEPGVWPRGSEIRMLLTPPLYPTPRQPHVSLRPGRQVKGTTAAIDSPVGSESGGRVCGR